MQNLPEANGFHVPVYVPTETGVAGDLVIGSANLKGGWLEVQLGETFPAVAIQNMMARGEIIGMTFVLVAPDEDDNGD